MAPLLKYGVSAPLASGGFTSRCPTMLTPPDPTYASTTTVLAMISCWTLTFHCCIHGVVWKGLLPHDMLVAVSTRVWKGRGKEVSAAGSVIVLTVHGWVNHEP